MSVTVRIGLLRLTDAAPVILAQEAGLFAHHGLDVALSVEPSWANIADKLAYGLLDAAVILPPLAIAASLGLRGPRADLIVPMGLSRGGNTVALSAAAAQAVAARQDGHGIMARGRAVAAWIRDASAGMGAQPRRPRLGIVHLFSGHNLLLRYWLAACGVVPDREIDFVVLPPAAMGDALAQGTIDGFCAGAPWGTLAEQDEVGRVVARGSEIWHRHPEKMLAVRRCWAEAEPARLAALLAALSEAARRCDDPDAADGLAALLAAKAHVDAPDAAIRLSLPGASPTSAADPIAFTDATAPQPSQAAWFARQMVRWGWMDAAGIPVAQALYRPDLAPHMAQAPCDERFCDTL